MFYLINGYRSFNNRVAEHICIWCQIFSLTIRRRSMYARFHFCFYLFKSGLYYIYTTPNKCVDKRQTIEFHKYGNRI